jgi:hypothetical protein
MKDTSSKEDAPMSEVLEGEFKGSAILIIRNTPQDKFPFQFGVRKARLILDHIDDIQKFVETHPNN